MEGLSAKNLDTINSNESDPKKERSVEHLREMRDVFTPFISKFAQLFNEGEKNFVELPSLNQPEIISHKDYKAIFHTLKDTITTKRLHFSSALGPIMFECMGDDDMYDLLYEQYLLTESKRREVSPAVMYNVTEIDTKEEALPLLSAMYNSFLKELDEQGLKEYFIKMNREKRLSLAKSAPFLKRNSASVFEEEMTKGSTENLGGISNYVHVENAKDVMYGFPFGAASKASSGAFDVDKVFPPIVVLPVGDYGKEFTQKIFLAMQAMYLKVDPLKEDAKSMVAAHEKMFKSTARGSNITESSYIERYKKIIEKYGQDNSPNVVTLEDLIKRAEDNYLAGLIALEEGIATLAQVLALFTSNKVKNFETGEELLKAILDQELPNKVGYMISPAVIGPLTLAGKTIKDIISLEDGGRLIINKDLLGFSNEKKEHFQNFSTDEVLPSSGRGCPVAFKGKDIEMSGINMLSKTFLKVFETLK